MTIILGIESTAHTFGVGVVKNGKILSNVKKSFSTGEGEGGMIPIEVAKFHRENKNEIYNEAIKQAGISEGEIGAIAYSAGPGLAPCLLEGMKFTKEIAHRRFDKANPPPSPSRLSPNEDELIKSASTRRNNLPVLGVNHCIAHLEIGKVTGAKDPVMLYASGANTQIIAYAEGKYRIFGETLDIGVGNFIDTIARSMKLGFPGGAKIEELAKGGEYIELPYSVKGMDVSFAGIQTKIRQLLKKDFSKKDLAYSMQETVFAMLVEVAERALAHTGKKELLLGGGVACNKRLQEMCRIMCEERGAKFFCPANSLLVDNAAMIAYLGEIMFKAGVREKNSEKIDIHPRERTDDVEVVWK